MYNECKFSRTALPQDPASPIFSLQIDPLPDVNTLVRNPIMMMFDVVRQHVTFDSIHEYGVVCHRKQLLLPPLAYQSKTMFKMCKTSHWMMYLVTFMTML